MDHHQQEDKLESIIDDEVLRNRIRGIINEPSRESAVTKVAKNPLITLLIGFLLTGVVGVVLTNHYNSKQKELEFYLSTLQRDRERERDQQEKQREEARDDRERQITRAHDDEQRQIEREKDARQKQLEFFRNASQRELDREKSFADELNKTRVQKIADVWENLYAVDSEVERYKALKQQYRPGPFSLYPPSQNQALAKELQTSADLLLRKSWNAMDVAIKNRFWLDEENYTDMMRYLRTSYEYAVSIGNGNTRREKEFYEAREHARQSIIKIKKSLLRL